MTNETVYFLVPEIILVLAATLIYVGGAFLPARPGWGWLAASAILLASAALYEQGRSEAGQLALSSRRSSGPLNVDLFSTTLRWAILGVALAGANLDSFERYALSAFPLVIAAAVLVRGPRLERAALVLLSAGLAGYALLAFLNLFVP